MTATPEARKRPSMADVAQEAGVSPAAVSKVLRNAYGVSPAMRQRVESAIGRLGYRPRVAARSMRGASYTVGFEVPHLGNDFFGQITDGAIAGLDNSGYQLVIAPSAGSRNGSTVLESLADRQVDGVIAIASMIDPEWLEGLAAEVPLVVIGRHDPSERYDTVTSDDIAGTKLALDHLEQLGHRHIAHLAIHPEGPHSPHTLRLQAYQRHRAEAGERKTIVYADGEEQAHQVTRDLLQTDDPPTGIFAGYDTLGMGALRATSELPQGRESVAVVGYDGIDIAAHPLISLSTVDQDGRRVGREAVVLLMQRIRDGRRDAAHLELSPTLRLGRSSHLRSLRPMSSLS